MRRDGESGKAEKPKNRVLCTPFSGSVTQLRFACLPLAASERSETEPPKKRVLCTLRSEGARNFSLWFCVQAARVARAARESGALHPPARLQRACGVICL